MKRHNALTLTQPRYPWLGFLFYITLLLTLAACGLLPNEAATREAEAEALLTRATEQEAAGESLAALQTLQEIHAQYGATNAASIARQNSARLLLAQAEAHRTAGEYEAALQAYGMILDAERLAEADTAVVETYREWVEALLAQGAYDTAVVQLDTLAAIQGDNPTTQQELASLRAEIALAQARDALARGDMAESYVNFVALLSQEPSLVGQTRYDTALSLFRQQAAPPLFAYAQERVAVATTDLADDDYSEATLIFEAIAQYGPPDLVPVAQTEAAAVTLRWGQALLAAQDYLEASEKFAYLLAFYPQSEAAEAGWVDAQVAYIQASGLAGELPALQANPDAVADLMEGTALYRVQNDTPCPIIILLSGPSSRLVRLAPTASGEATLTAGDYTAVVQPDKDAELTPTCQDIAPFLGQYDLISGTIYNARFFTSAEQ